MKRYSRNMIALLLAGIMLWGMTACNGSGRESESEQLTDVTQKDVSGKTTGNPTISNRPGAATSKNTDVPDSTIPPISDITTADDNVFFNDTNFHHDLNAVSIKPRYVYWEDGKLIAECFVINGYDHAVYNINVNSLALGNESGLIAEGSFGMLEGLALAPYTYHVWKFIFAEDTVSMNNADLSSLLCQSSLQYGH